MWSEIGSILNIDGPAKQIAAIFESFISNWKNLEKDSQLEDAIAREGMVCVFWPDCLSWAQIKQSGSRVYPKFNIRVDNLCDGGLLKHSND